MDAFLSQRANNSKWERSSNPGSIQFMVSSRVRGMGIFCSPPSTAVQPGPHAIENLLRVRVLPVG